MEIRLFKKSDAEQVAQLFFDTVHIVNRQDYSEEQIRAWAPDNIHFRNWEKSCLEKFTLVTELNGTIIGFAQFEDNGHIDCFYCHHEHQKQGVGTQLYNAIEDYARTRRITKIYTEASITARPFFMKMGFSYVQKQKVLIRGEILTNYIMEKEIK